MFYNFIDGRRTPNIENLRKHLLREGHINKAELMELIAEATKILSRFLSFWEIP